MNETWDKRNVSLLEHHRLRLQFTRLENDIAAVVKTIEQAQAASNVWDLCALVEQARHQMRDALVRAEHPPP